jgi:hypothetical protein
MLMHEHSYSAHSQGQRAAAYNLLNSAVYVVLIEIETDRRL